MPDGFIDVTIQFEGQAALIGKFATWGRAIGDLTPAWEKVGYRLQDDWREQFMTEGNWLGAGIAPPWLPLRPATVADRLRKGFGAGPILRRTGMLAASATVRGAAWNVFEVGPDHVTVGTQAPYAGFHQRGTRKMPPRKFIGLKWTTRSDVLSILDAYVRQQAAAAGLHPGL